MIGNEMLQQETAQSKTPDVYFVVTTKHSQILRCLVKNGTAD